MKRRIIAAATSLAATAALAVTGAGPASAGGTTTIHLVATSQTSHINDWPPKHQYGPGDQVQFTESEHLASNPGRQVGRNFVNLTVTDRRGDENVSGTLSFANGSSLTNSGVIRAPFTTIQLAVTGGTGRYIGARGQVVVVPTSDTQANETVTLVS
jgi:hypothetical protein